MKTDATTTDEHRFDVVALAASAGGIEAVTAVLRALGPDFPAAIVVAMHLPAMSSDRITTFQSHSPLPTAFLEHGDAIRPGHVYVVPPARAVELEPDGTATVVDHLNARYPIDATLTSIAESYGARAIAVVLTGMRDDGARGVRAIKQWGGHVLVQSPETAQHPRMPEAAIATGVVDLVLPLGEIGRTLEACIARGALPPSPERVAAIEGVFGGPGEMRQILRRINWSATSLGPVEGWTPELVTILRTMLAAGVPMSLVWGPELVYFYNDAHLPLIRSRHPCAGRPFASTWAEAWEQTRPTFERIRATGEPVLVTRGLFPLELGGRLEERYYTIAFTPIATANGVEGILWSSVDATDDVLASRRIETLARLASLPSVASPSDAYARLVAALGTNPQDLAFVLAYELDHTRRQARLKAATGLEPAAALAPQVVDLMSGRDQWPLASLIERTEPLHVTDLLVRFADRVSGPWGEPTSDALLLPLGATGPLGPTGALIVGLNRRRPLDAAYREFLELVAAQVSAAVTKALLLSSTRDRADALTEANRAKSEFFSNVSHELRTPLTLILGPMERARAARGVPDGVLADLEVADRNARRLLALVSALLDVAQADARRLTPRPELIDLSAETNELAGLFRAAIEHAGLRFIVDCAATRQVSIDRAMWAKIVVNLLSNALKFTFEGEIRVTLGERAQHAELVVSDTGVGIAADDRPHVFDRFFRARDQRARSHEGSGIGLALVRELVRAQGGRVRLKSEEGCGSTFTIWLPLRPRRNPAPPVPGHADETAREVGRALADQALAWTQRREPPAAVVREPAELDGLDAVRRGTAAAHVLAVDDNADMRAYLERLLGEMGWRVDTACDGEEAFARASVGRPDLIVADVMMPRSDGFQLLRRIRADAALRMTPVVLVTARAGESAAVEGMVAGADDYITKPFTARELVARLGAQIQLARVRRRAERLDGHRVALIDALASIAEPYEVQRTACRILREQVGAVHAGYFSWLDPETLVMAAEDVAPGRAPFGEGPFRVADFHPSLARVFHTGQTVWRDDVAEDPEVSPDGLAAFVGIGVRAWAVATMVKEGRGVGCVGLYFAEPHRWTADELHLLEDTAQRTWTAVERARSDAALRSSEAQYRGLSDTMREPYCVIEVLLEGDRAVDYRFLEVNPAFEQQTGTVDAVGRLMREVAPDHETIWLETYGRVARTGEPAELKHRAGRLGRDVAAYAWRIGDPSQHRVAILLRAVSE